MFENAAQILQMWMSLQRHDCSSHTSDKPDLNFGLPSILSFDSLGVGEEWALTDIYGRDGDACSFVRRRLLECKASEAIKSFVCLLGFF